MYTSSWEAAVVSSAACDAGTLVLKFPILPVKFILKRQVAFVS
jgi:hypothetical protein